MSSGVSRKAAEEMFVFVVLSLLEPFAGMWTRMKDADILNFALDQPELRFYRAQVLSNV